MLTIFLSGSAFGWTISGNSVIEEDAQNRITVTPHTAVSPMRNFSQEFELCNKTGTAATVYAAYLFNYALSAGKVEDWLPVQYDWVSKQFVCDYNFVYKLNVDADRNPHWAKCFQVTDTNGYDENIVLFERDFKTGNIPTRTVTYDINSEISNARWRNVTDYFTANQTTINGKYIYPYISGYNLQANSCKKWKISYTPRSNDRTEKWELWLWAGSNWNCILNDTCTKVLKLDPWWDDDFAFVRAINLPAQDISRNTRIQIPIDFTTFFSVQTDLDDVRIVDENNNVELADGACEKNSASTDGNCFFTMPYEMASTNPNIDTTYYVYYGNAGATAPTFGDTADTNTCSFESWQECGLKFDTADRNSDVFKFGATSAEISLWSLDRVEANGLGSRSSDLNYSTWFYLDNVTVAGGILFDMRSGGGNDLCQMGINSGLDIGIYSHTFTYSAIGTLALHNWYQTQIHYTDSDANCQYSVYNSTGGLVASANFDTRGGVPAVTDYFLIQGYNADDRMLIDQFYSGAPLLATGLGAEQDLFFDANINSIDGYPISSPLPVFDYDSDGNLTIGFSVFNIDNNAMAIDINYGTSSIQGSGTVIVNDLNLGVSVCSGAQTWDINIVYCTWDFNIMGVADGNYFISIDVNTGSQSFFKTTTKSMHILFYDLVPPTATLWFDFNNNGFSEDLNASRFIFSCTDNSTTNLFFDLNVNNVNIMNGWYTAGTRTQDYNTTSATLEADYSCTDISGNVTSGTKFLKANRTQFILVNENTGSIFNLSDINSLIVYVPDKNVFYDFKANNSTSVFFSDINNFSLWFELKYTGDSITTAVRHFSMGSFDLNTIRICVPPFNPVLYTHYAVSSMSRKISVKNRFADCYIMWGSIDYVYQTNYLSQLFLINQQYDLTLYIDSSSITLGRIDGSVESTINIDALYYSLMDYNLSVSGDGLHISKLFENFASIAYKNIAQNSILTILQIYDGTTLLWTYNETASPNDFNILFNYTGISFTNESLRLVLTKTLSTGAIETVITYFTLENVIIHILPAALAVVIAFVLVIFSISFVAYRFAMGWFGIISCMIAIGILALAEPVWYIPFSQAILVIVIIFISLIYKSENVAVS